MAYPKQVTITPSMAGEWLKKNIRNRKISSQKVNQYFADIKAGRWHANISTPIMFDEDGNLGNGQHRLQACISAGVSFTDTVYYDVSAEALKFVDVGKPRSINDFLALDGRDNVTVQGSLINLIIRYESGTLFRFKTNPSRGQQVIAQENHPEVKEYAALVKILPVQKPALSFIWWLFGQVHPNKTKTFFEQFASGENITKKDAAWHLRQKLIVNKPKGGRYTQENVLSSAIAALNAHMTGETIKRLRPSTDPFFIKNGKKKAAAA